MREGAHGGESGNVRPENRLRRIRVWKAKRKVVVGNDQTLHLRGKTAGNAEGQGCLYIIMAITLRVIVGDVYARPRGSLPQYQNCDT